MDNVVELHRMALSEARRRVAAVPAAAWESATPCTEWNLRSLVNHIVTGNWWAAELAAGSTIAEVGDRLDGDVLGSEPLSAYDASSAAADAAFSAPGAMDAPCAVSYGPVPGSVYATHRFFDVLIHGWDVAVASGQDPTMPPVLVDACWEAVAPDADMLRASGMFGTDVTVAPGADRQTQLLALLGRVQ